MIKEISQAIQDIIRASVRPALGWMAGLTFVYLSVRGFIAVETVVTVIGMVFVFYFQSRTNEKTLEKFVKGLKEK